MRIEKCFLGLFIFVSTCINAQTNLGNSFSGKNNPASELCPQSKSAFTDQNVNQLISKILDLINIKNRFIIVPCPGISNCQAIYYEGKPYILYNAEFLNEIKSLSFSEKDLEVSDRNWESLTILAHELGHHFNNHLNNPPPGATAQQLELEADEFAGSTIYLLGGTLIQAQSAFKNIPIEASYTHPNRDARMAAVAKGSHDASFRFINKGGKNPEPVVTKKFNSVKIGVQEWMSDNLNVDHFRNGDIIHEAKNKEEWITANEKKEPVWCYYNFDEKNNEIYGKYYNGFAVSDLRGLAPEGWRIPSRADFELLLSSNNIKKRADPYDFKNYSYPIGASIFRSLVGWPQETKIASKIIGFNALPSGGISIWKHSYYDDKNKKWFGPPKANFFGQSSQCDLWSIDKYDKYNDNTMIAFGIRSEIDDVIIYLQNMNMGFPVRCVKNK